MKHLFVFIIMASVLFTNRAFADQFPARFSGEVLINGQQAVGAKVLILNNNEVVFNTTVKELGFIIKLELSGDYFLQVEKPGFLSPIYEISTFTGTEKAPASIPEFEIGVINLIEDFPGIDKSFFKKPVAKILYNSSRNAFEFDMPYKNSVDKKIEALVEQIRQLKENPTGKNPDPGEEASNNETTENPGKTEIIQEETTDPKTVSDNNIGTSPQNTKLQEKGLKELQDELKNLSDDFNQAADLQLQIGKVHFGNGNPDLALTSLNEALKLKEKTGDASGMADVLSEIAKVDFDLGNFEASLDNYEYAANLKEQVGKQDEAAAILNESGMLAADLYRYDKALADFKDALSLLEEKGDRPATTAILNNIGNIYFEKGDLDKALEAFNKSLEINQEIGNMPVVATALNNIGAALHNKGDFEGAIDSYEKSIDVAEELGNKKDVSISLNNIGNVNYDWNKFNKALEYYHQSLKIKEQIDYKKGVAYTFHNIGNVHQALKQYEDALAYYEKSNILAAEMNLKELLQKNYAAISKVYYALQDCENAYKYYNLFNETGVFTASSNEGQLTERETSFQSPNKDIQITELKEEIEKQKLLTKFQAQSKEMMMALKNKEIEEKELIGQKQKTVIYMLGGGFLIFLILLIIIIKENRQKKHAFRKLEGQKEEIEKQATQLLIVNKELDKLSVVARETDNSVIMANATGEIEWVNEGFTRLTGYTLPEFIEEKGNNIIENSSNPELASIIQECEKTGESRIYTSLTNNRNGDVLWIQTTLTPIFNEDNKLHHFIAIDSDITKIKLAEEEIFNQKEEMTDSIHYAKRIQAAIFPPMELINKLIPQHLILYKPRDIVSGDFYWINHIEGVTVIAVSDCTGHGVPGAFMSMLGVAFLNEIILKEYITHTGVILKRLRKEIIRSLQQQGNESGTKDGMDIAICALNDKTKEAQFSGANNPMYLVRNNELIVHKGDKMPIGIYDKMDKFTVSEFQYEKNDIIYLFSDGYADQFGGPKGKKLKYKQFKNILLEINSLPMKKQEQILDQKLSEWQRNYEQIDDITVLGVRL